MNKPVNLAQEEARRDLKRVSNDPKRHAVREHYEKARFHILALIDADALPEVRQLALTMDASLHAAKGTGLEEILKIINGDRK